MATTLPDLPTGTRFDVRRSDPTIFPILGVALTSPTLDPQALRQIAELQVRPALTAVNGVAGVDILGGAPREFAVDVDPARASAVGLSLADVAAAVGKGNDVQGVGRLEDRHRLYLVLTQNRLAGIADLKALPVKAGQTAGSGLVTLGQIATITPSVEPSYTRVTSDGSRAVLINVRQTPAGDSVRIVKDVDARLAALGLPPSVKVTPFYDQSELVTGGRQRRARRDPARRRARRAGVVRVPPIRAPDGDHRGDAARRARGHLPCALCVRDELQHDDAGRHGRGGRPRRRRRRGDARTYHAAHAGGRCQGSGGRAGGWRPRWDAR